MMMGHLAPLKVLVPGAGNDYNWYTSAGSPPHKVRVDLFTASNRGSSSTAIPVITVGTGWRAGTKLYHKNSAVGTGAPGTNQPTAPGGAAGAGGQGGDVNTGFWGAAGGGGTTGGSGSPGTAGGTALSATGLPVNVILQVDNAGASLVGGTLGAGGPAGAGGGGGGGGGGVIYG